MQTETIDLDDAQAHLKELVHRVSAGTHVILSENKKPVARLIPASERIPGLHPDSIWTREDFDREIPEEFWTEGK